MPKPEVDVGVVTFTPLKQPYIDLPFSMVEKVTVSKFDGLLITILFQGGHHHFPWEAEAFEEYGGATLPKANGQALL